MVNKISLQASQNDTDNRLGDLTLFFFRINQNLDMNQFNSQVKKKK